MFGISNVILSFNAYTSNKMDIDLLLMIETDLNIYEDIE